MAIAARRQPQGRATVRSQYARNLSMLYLGGRGEVVGASNLQSVVQPGTNAATPGGVGLVNGLRRYKTVPAMQPTTALTIVATLWIGPSTGDRERVFIGQDAVNAPYSGYEFQRGNDGRFSFGVGDSSGQITEITEATAALGLHTYVCSFDGKTLSMYRDQVLVASAGRTSGIAYPAGAIPFIGAYYDGANPTGTKLNGGIIALALWAERAFSANESASVSANPWQLFDAPSQTQVPMAAAAPAGVSGSITWTEASDSAAAAGSVTVSGAAAWTEAADSAALAGSVGSAVGINAAWTEAADSVAIAITARVNAAAAWTEAADTISMAGSAGSSLAANISWTEAADVTAVAGTIRINAAGSWTEAGDTAAIVVNVAAAQSAALSWTEAPDGIAIAANVVAAPVVGAIAWTEAADISAVATYPRFYAYTLMRADPVSAAGYISGSATQFTLMRSNPLYAASAMTDAPLNRTVNLI